MRLKSHSLVKKQDLIEGRFITPEWQRKLTVSRVGYCDGRNIATLKCNLYATLYPVYYAGKTIWLCGKCLDKLKKKRSRFSRPVPRW